MPDEATRPATMPAGSPLGRQRVFRPGPGMLVLPIVLLFVLAGVGAFILAGAHGKSPPTTATVTGPLLPATDATAGFAPLEHAGEPPADVLSQVPVPLAASVVGRQNHDRGNGVFDRAIDLTVDAPYNQVVAFYRTELASHHWLIISRGPPRSGSGRQILGRRPSRDGFYWEVGATIRAPGSTPGAATQIQLRLLEDDEEQ